MEAIEYGLGLDIVLWFQSWRSPAVEAFFRPFNYGGGMIFYLLLLPLIYWCFSASFGRRVNLLFLGVVWLNMLLKQWWARPRPFQIWGGVDAQVTPRGPGIPSGHTMMATAVWGVVAAWARRPWLTWVLMGVIVLMGLSRLVEGAHFPQDVLAGWLLGGAAVVFFVWGEPRLAAWITARSLTAQLGLAALAAALMLAIFPGLIRPVRAGYELYGVVAAGQFLGTAAGFALEYRYLGFSAEGRVLPRIGRFFLGAAILAGLHVGLHLGIKAISPKPDLLHAVLQFNRFVLTGLWLGLGAPWLFVKVGLAQQAEETS